MSCLTASVASRGRDAEHRRLLGLLPPILGVPASAQRLGGRLAPALPGRWRTCAVRPAPSTVGDLVRSSRLASFTRSSPSRCTGAISPSASTRPSADERPGTASPLRLAARVAGGARGSGPSAARLAFSSRSIPAPRLGEPRRAAPRWASAGQGIDRVVAGADAGRRRTDDPRRRPPTALASPPASLAGRLQGAPGDRRLPAAHLR